jgi:hypothetical protein
MEIQAQVLDYSTVHTYPGIDKKRLCSCLVQYTTGLTVLVSIVKRTHCHALNMQFYGYSF